MNSQIKIALLSAALTAFALPVVAQNTDASASSQVTGQSINQRKENQQDRIANGVKSGELTAGETANLEKKESNLNEKRSRQERREPAGPHRARHQKRPIDRR
jgi:hypothetical protein